MGTDRKRIVLSLAALESLSVYGTIEVDRYLIAILYCGTQGLLKGVPLDKVHDFEKEFLRELHTSHQHDVLDILKTGTINDDIRKKLEETAKQLTMNN